jgi:hypothetical protein
MGQGTFSPEQLSSKPAAIELVRKVEPSSGASGDKFIQEALQEQLTAKKKEPAEKRVPTAPDTSETLTPERALPHVVFNGTIGACDIFSKPASAEERIKSDKIAREIEQELCKPADSAKDAADAPKKDPWFKFSFDYNSFDTVKTPQHDASENDIWDKTQRFFGHEDTLSDRVRSKVLRSLTPDQKTSLEAKDAKSPLGVGSSPDGLEAKIDAEKEKIAAQVKADMSQSERAVLQKQIEEYQAAQRREAEIFKRGGPGFIPIEPGDALKAYWAKLKAKTEAYAA